MKKMVSVDEHSRIQVDDKQTKTQPLRIKIKMVTTNVNIVKQETTSGKDEMPEDGYFKLSGVWVTFSCGLHFLERSNVMFSFANLTFCCKCELPALNNDRTHDPLVLWQKNLFLTLKL